MFIHSQYLASAVRMQSIAVHRDLAKPGQGRRPVLRGQVVYRIQHESSDAWLINLPTNAERLKAWLEQLASAGIDVLWFSINTGKQASGWGLCLSQTLDLIAAPALPTSLRTIAELALSAGLRVLADLQALRQFTAPEPLVYTPPLTKQSCFRWTDDRHRGAELEHADEENFGLLRLARCPDWIHQECKAPYAHATLTHFYRRHGRGWPIWLVGAEWLQFNLDTSDVIFDPRVLTLALALPMCLKGSPLLDHMHVGDTHEVPLPIARFLIWRRTVPALRYGKMQLLGMHENLLMFTRQDTEQCVLCVFNLSERFVRQSLPPMFTKLSLIAGSGLDGARIINSEIDCDPWGALFAQQCSPQQ